MQTFAKYKNIVSSGKRFVKLFLDRTCRFSTSGGGIYLDMQMNICYPVKELNDGNNDGWRM